MINLTYVEIVDTILGALLIIYIAWGFTVSRRSHRMLKQHCGCHFNLFKLFCNHIYGLERMSWMKMVSTLAMVTAFVSLMSVGSFFGLVGFLTIGIAGLMKIGHSIEARLQLINH